MADHKQQGDSACGDGPVGKVNSRPTTADLDDHKLDSVPETAISSRSEEYPPSVYMEKRAELIFLVLLSALTTTVSSFAVPIYFPALDSLARAFDTTVEKINVTATMYSIFQGVSPIVWGTLSDGYGRRPVYLACLGINLAACIGLACSQTYWDLFGIRCLQAFGGAAAVALGYAIVGDVTQRKNRGGVMGMASSVSLLGNCFGPIIGGALLQRFGWRGIFWFLSIYSGIIFFLIFLLFPETNRQLTGNGSIMPKPWINKSPYAYFRHKLVGVPYTEGEVEYSSQWRPAPRKMAYFRWVYLLMQPDVILILIPMSVFYTTWFMVLTAQSTTLETVYGLPVQHVGYTYLASGMGLLASSLGAGQLMQRIYRHEYGRFEKQCKEQGVPARLEDFNIYHARLSMTFLFAAILIVATLVFCWTLEYKVTFYVPVVMTFFVSMSASYVMSTTSTLLIDVYPADAATAVSCANLTRCLLCAAGLAAVDKMMRAIKTGPAFTIMSALCALSVLCLVAELKFGRKFAERRRAREQSGEFSWFEKFVSSS